MKKLAICLLSILFAIGLLATEPDVVCVKGRGTGVDEVSALKDAYRDVVETAVGLFVDAEQMMQNETIIKEQILTQSNAYILSYDVMSKEEVNGLVSIKIMARVKKQELVKKTSCMMESKTIQVGDSLKNIHARGVSLEKRGADAATLINERLSDLSLEKMLCDCEMVSSEPVVEKRSFESSNAKVKIAYAFRRSINEDRYFNEVMPKIRQVLSQVSLSEPREATVSATRKIFSTGKPLHDIESFMLDTERAFRSDAWMEETVKMESSAFSFNGTYKGRARIDGRSDGPSARVVLFTGINKLKTVYTVEIYEIDGPVAMAFNKWLETARKECNVTKSQFTVSFLDDGGDTLEEGAINASYPGRCLQSQVARFKDLPAFTIGPFFFADGGRSACAWDCRWRNFAVSKDAMPLIKSIRIDAVK